MKRTKTVLLRIEALCAALLLAAALLCGCGGRAPAPGQAVSGEISVRGEGSRVFSFTVAGPDGVETGYEIHTDCETVGDALQALGLIEGEQGAFGLYVKTVAGVTLDYDRDGMYWAFYEDGAYAAHGVSETKIADGAAYAFRAEAQ